MRKLAFALPLMLLFGCAFRDVPNRAYVNENPARVRNQVGSIPEAAAVLIDGLVARNESERQIAVALLPVRNRYLESGVSSAILNGIQDELFARKLFRVQKDYDLESVKQMLAINYGQRGFLDINTAKQIANYTRADAIITCEVQDAIDFWQIHVALTPVNTNFMQASATCYIPKRTVIQSQIFR